jgi:hypothetical protein
MIRPRAFVTGVAVVLVVNSIAVRAQAPFAVTPSDAGTAVVVAVTGSGVDHLVTAIVHSKENTPTGNIQKSTEIVDLTGDLKGRVLYHVTTVLDSVHATLVNTGNQVYSGTIGGSAPVMLHDDHFRFEVDLKTGSEKGRVYLVDHIAGPKVRCTLDVVGTGMNAEGNPTFTYTGQCIFGGP